MSESPKPLLSATFLGLLLAQFTATFNDQALHIVAIFFASDLLVRLPGASGIDEKAVVAMVTACFILPFLLFSPLAGVLADRFSKRSIIVFWKVIETLIMLLALVALSLPRWFDPEHPAASHWPCVSAGLAVFCVFLMGVHSTFFVPAKYGVMPEILDPSHLSRGNGLLEGTSFMAQIFGTAGGGLLYAIYKSEVSGGRFVAGHEWFIGLLLLALALLGNGAAFLMKRLPAAAPDVPIDWSWWRPLRSNLKLVASSRPLTLAITGIAFAAFLTLFMRQTLLYEAEIKKEVAALEQLQVASAEVVTERQPVQDRTFGQRLHAALDEAEMHVSLLIALVGFGVGLGSLLAGFLSGDRVELGLVPVGGIVLVVLFLVLALARGQETLVTGLLFLIGLSAGLYIVPLYTLMQHRAPRDQKGNVVAASNFVNVAGGVVSVLLFYALTFLLERFFGPTGSFAAVQADPTLRPAYLVELIRSFVIPQWLYALTSLIVVVTAVRLVVLQPDFDVRLREFLRGLIHARPRVSGLHHVPASGFAVLLTDCRSPDEACRLIAVVDRTMWVLGVPESPSGEGHPQGLPFTRHRIRSRPGGGALDLPLSEVRTALSSGELLAVAVDDLDRDLAPILRLVNSAAAGRMNVPILIAAIERDGIEREGLGRDRHDRDGAGREAGGAARRGGGSSRGGCPSIRIEAWSPRVHLAETNSVA